MLISIVEEGLGDSTWQGCVYIMHFGTLSEIEPLYVGKAERKGVTQSLSFNLRNIRTNQHAFGRWGYGLDYHIGDLSHAIFREAGRYKQPSPKYRRWADLLFESLDPPCLRRLVEVSWRTEMRGPSGLIGSVPAIEKELIALCSACPKARLLNLDGR